MTWLSKKPHPHIGAVPAPAAEKSADGAAGREAQTASFTNGSALGSRTVGALAVVALLCGPLALGVAVAHGGSRPVAVAAPAPAQLTGLQQSSGAYAVGLVGTWLSATATDSAGLQAYVSTAPAGLGQTPFRYRDLAVARITPRAGQQVVDVLVAGDVFQQPAAGAAGSTPAWVRRYFEVTVSTAGGELAALGLPAPQAGPATTTTGGLYTVQLPSTAPAAQSIQLMLTAYLTGVGATTAYLTPGVSISPISPAPYSSLQPVSFYADRDPGTGMPAAGSRLHVQAAVTLQTADGQEVTATYFVLLTARAGRWEITGLDPTAPASSTAVPSPSHATEPTKGEER